ncbi:hypothetical protein [Agarivorans aestuarii]|uniref:hypothetical protein n=1 Tax=Agarivorans aestuarii TaxID=1563703 RepID=UPI001C821E0C|nr:hypothetical protein [Agarivorans aestuarii]
MDLPTDVTNLFSGFFKNYMWSLVNDDSNDQYLYDAILSVSIEAIPLFDKAFANIRMMAELGHAPSMTFLAEQYTGSRQSIYWQSRCNLKQ